MYIYGLSLSPLDAELTQVLTVGLKNSNCKQIIIIDPNSKKVADRLHLSLIQFNKKIPIYGYHPMRLRDKIKHY